MPSASDFQKIFNLSPGAALYFPQDKGGEIILAEVRQIKIKQSVKKQNEIYEFHSKIDLEIKEHTTRHVLEVAAKQYLSGRGYGNEEKENEKEERVVLSSFGSPYAYNLESIKIDSFDPDEAHASITFVGKAIRKRDRDALGNENGEKRRTKEARAARKRKKKDELEPQLRIMKSRFSSNKCFFCSKVMEEGATIAKDAKYTKHGGWMHVSCAVEQAKINKKMQNFYAFKKNAVSFL
jgi:hypothetical protein